MITKTVSLWFLAIFTVWALPASAHDYWIERDGNDYVLYQGHLYSSHKDEERVPYSADIVKRAVCVLANGAAEAALARIPCALCRSVQRVVRADVLRLLVANADRYEEQAEELVWLA